MAWSEHKHAPAYLSGMSFAESVFFPIPPDVLLIPMTLAKPLKAWQFALYTTIASVFGGILGYFLGMLMFEPLIQPIIDYFNYQHKFDQIMAWFGEYGVWVVFLAGFSPIPYKVFTLSAGLLHMAFLPFVLASAVGRGMRFFLVAGLVKWGGKRIEDKLQQYIEWIGWGTVALAVLAYFLIKH